MKTYYILYQVTNNLNGKIYVGVHKTKSLDDGYMGSGKVINAAIAKYGVENFTRVILEQFDDSAAMFAREKEVVTEEFLAREDTYNLRRGGFGGFDYINSSGLAVANLTNLDTQKRARAGLRAVYGDDCSAIVGAMGGNACYQKHPLLAKNTILKNIVSGKMSFKDKHHSADAKSKIGAANAISQLGEKNSQFGSKWITNEVESKKIKNNEPVPEGWRAGRVMRV